MTKFQKKLWAGLLIIAFLTPLGIIIPEKFKAGSAWGEWGADTLAKLIGYVPEGLRRWAGLWKAPIPDYNMGGEGASGTVQIVSYTASGLIGAAAVGVLIYVIGRIIIKNGK
ncbi:MAG: hypothetical protein P8013_13480 [Candidatus Sulfobium sp.]|jgi:cobalt/nickel transport protein